MTARPTVLPAARRTPQLATQPTDPPTPQRGARLLGIGGYRPPRVVYNEEICEAINSSDEWIRRRSGVVTRQYADTDTVVSMGTEAARKALAAAGIAAERVDTVLLASMSYLHQSPPAAPQVAHALGATASAAMDVGAACAGFCHALALADSLVRAGTSRCVVVVGTEKMTDVIDPTDRSTAFLFGDGAGAVVVGPADTRDIGPVCWGADGSRGSLIAHSSSWLGARSGGPWPTMRMRGSEVFRWVLQEIAPVAAEAVAAAGITVADLAAFVPHQANLRLITGLAKALGLPPSVVIADDVRTAGNTSAASIPLALERLADSGAVGPGDRVLLSGFGAGLSYASQVITL
ncbi:MAG: beta-ketoacyl-ACP synthase 3 [Catenulispora sp.]|nr:beta-ketoacyl-ACP synthase 3 [Catenulispora sp.]